MDRSSGKTRGLTRGSAALAAVLLAAGLATPALASKPKGDASGTLEVKLVGSITSSCRVTGGGALDFGELTGGETATALFGLGCNVPFDLNFQSARGGLAHVTKPQGEGPFAGTLGYTLDVATPVKTPRLKTLHASFTSHELAGRRTLSSGDGIAAGGGLIKIRTDRPAGAGLLAGQYSEVLTISVTPRV